MNRHNYFHAQRSGHQFLTESTPASKPRYPMVHTSIFLLPYSFHFSFVCIYCNATLFFTYLTFSLVVRYFFSCTRLRHLVFSLVPYSFVLQMDDKIMFPVDHTSLSLGYLCKLLSLFMYSLYHLLFICQHIFANFFKFFVFLFLYCQRISYFIYFPNIYRLLLS